MPPPCAVPDPVESVERAFDVVSRAPFHNTTSAAPIELI
jgi:hypothetical protein